MKQLLACFPPCASAVGDVCQVSAETDGTGAEVQEESGGNELRQHSLYHDVRVSDA